MKTVISQQLTKQESEQQEQALYECALAVENDAALQDEMNDWAVTLGDGLSDESW